jgi:carbamoyltransferase
VFILGISSFYHDSSACLLKDGEIVAAALEERFTRKKHDNSFPINAINFVLSEANISSPELDYVVFYEKPFLKIERILISIFQTVPKSFEFFRRSIDIWLRERLWIKNLLKEKLKIEERKIMFVEHHISHAASSFFCSPYEKAAILTCDGVGEWATTTLGAGCGNKIKILKELKFPHSLGLLYSAFTEFLGFEVNEGEYKVMAMSGYGEPKYLEEIYKLGDFSRDGSFSLNMDYFSYHYSTKKSFSLKFEKIFGKPRELKDSENFSQYYADVAASIQKFTEEILIKIANYLYRETGLKKLCIAGGVALNSVANWKILKETPFEEIYIQPAAGDAGGAVGCALYFYHSILNKPRKFVMEHAYFGKKYSEDEIKDFLERKCIKYDYIKNEEKLLDKISLYLIEGKVIGYFKDRFEWGPRALGNRSILADPRNFKMKEIVNKKIKFREIFRPFAPSILIEETQKYFSIENPEIHYPLKFMLYVLDVKEKKREIIPAVVHVDGTARPQVVEKDKNFLYYSLIKKFGERTGVPVILNTSFNLKGEPIVNSPEDAFNTFLRSEMDILVIEKFIIER